MFWALELRLLSKAGLDKGLPDCQKCHKPYLADSWGCKGPSESFSYNLGGTNVDRCPNALRKQRIVQEAGKLWAPYRRGITPNGRGLRHETAFYCWAMEAFESMDVEAEEWYAQRRQELGIKDG